MPSKVASRVPEGCIPGSRVPFGTSDPGLQPGGTSDATAEGTSANIDDISIRRFDIFVIHYNMPP